MTSISFAEAQQRVLTRQHQREAERHSFVEARKKEIASSRAARLPFPLGSLGSRTLETWDKIKGREGTQPEFRVGQLDAELLDEQLLELLQEQIREGLKYFGVRCLVRATLVMWPLTVSQTHLSQDWSAEISLALRAALFKLSIWDHNASYGATLQGLQYVDARHKGVDFRAPSGWQKALYGLFSVGGRYAWTRWEDWLLAQQADRPPVLPPLRSF